MGTIATGLITLSTVNDSYSVSLSPSCVVIKTDSDGGNAILTNAFTNVSVIRGTESVKFTLSVATGNDNLTTTTSDGDDNTKKVAITKIPTDKSCGDITLTITVGSDYKEIRTFSYTTINESGLLDWMQDWNKNTTEIGSKFIVSPQIFAGKKDSDDKLTGVYLGRTTSNDTEAGIYGYVANKIVFQINESGASLGGWTINTDSIVSPHKNLKITSSSEGSSIIADDGTSTSNIYWALYEDGKAVFANNKVLFNSDGSGQLAGGKISWGIAGDAAFTGSITAASGTIGGWNIGSTRLYGTNVRLQSGNNPHIAIAASAFDDTVDASLLNIRANGGIYIHYTSFVDYGIVGYSTYKTSPNKAFLAFSLGYSNFIAGWSFDETGLWLGTKNNTEGAFTESAGSITIGTSGLRGYYWYIDANGNASFANGKVLLTSDKSTISGWTLENNSLTSDSIKISCIDSTGGLYMGVESADYKFYNLTDAKAIEEIKTYGGIYLAMVNGKPELNAITSDKQTAFRLVSGASDTNTSIIAGWKFNDNAMWLGTKYDTTGTSLYTATASSITLGTSGLRGSSWYIDVNGNAVFAKGAISLNADTSTISGWTIKDNSLSSTRIKLSSGADTAGLYIGNQYDNSTIDYTAVTTTDANIIDDIIAHGGIYFARTTENCTLAAYNYDSTAKTSKLAFQLSSTGVSSIAGWSFDSDSIYINGNIYDGTTGFAKDKSLILSTSGLRGSSWCIDANGNASFASGWVKLSANTSTISGWTLVENSLTSTHIRLSSNKDTAGLYIGTINSKVEYTDTTVTDAAIVADIAAYGGIYFAKTTESCMLAAYYGSNLAFKLTSNITNDKNQIAGWTFNNSSIYCESDSYDGTTGFAKSDSLILSTSGLRGSSWCINPDGSGALANNRIKWAKDGSGLIAGIMSWDIDGNISLDNSVIVQWEAAAQDAKSAAEEYSLALSSGLMLYRDPTFISSCNSIGLYNNSHKDDEFKYVNGSSYVLANHESWVYDADNNYVLDANGNREVKVDNSYTRTVSMSRDECTTAYNGSNRVLKITNTGEAIPGLGGFDWGTQSSSGKIYLIRLVAKIPANRKIEFATNEIGTNRTIQWLTDVYGTGDWKEYLLKVKCGYSGNFGTTNYFHINEYTYTKNSDGSYTASSSAVRGSSSNPVTWYLSYATVFDMTNTEKVTTTIDANGVYTGTLNAKQINAGTIDASKIDTECILSGVHAWGLMSNGSGYLANKNIYWETDGSAFFKGEITASSGNIGNWIISNGNIVSDSNASPAITLDAEGQQILINSATSGDEDNNGGTGGGSLLSSVGSKIEINAKNGRIEVNANNAPSYSTGTAYVSPTGIFANLAGTNALPTSSGYSHRGAIVGLGFANVDKIEEWSLNGDQTMVAGVYGRASNNGNAPAYGGYFNNLKAAGFILNTFFVTDSTDEGTRISTAYSVIIGLTNRSVHRKVYLPSDTYDGRTVKFIQMGAGSMYVYPYGGQRLYNDSTADDYVEVGTGYTYEFTFATWLINSISTQVWIFRRYSS